MIAAEQESKLQKYQSNHKIITNNHTHDYIAKVIDYDYNYSYIFGTQLQITFDYLQKCNRLQLITFTNCNRPMSVNYIN